jgi:hypothetical protein
MKNAIKVFLYAATVMIISCHKETLNSPATLTPGSTPGSVVFQQASDGIFDSLSWTSWPGNLWCLQRFGGDIFLKHSYNSNFESAYYNDHVRVFVKQADALLWTNVPYDRGGQNNYSLYFTDDNYVVSFPPPLSVTINAPRILVLAKPAAPIDFSKKVSAKIIFI